MEDDATRPEPPGLGSQSNEPAELAKRLREIEEEAATIRASLQPQMASSDSEPEDDPNLQQEVQEDVIPKVGETQSDADLGEPIAPPTAEQLATAENLIRQSLLARQRKQNQRAQDLLVEAEKAAPNAPVVLEAIGDDYFSRGQLMKARQAYEKAFRIDPTNVAIERKFGLTLVRTDSGASALQASMDESPASAKVPALLSAIIPGLGQIVAGDVRKGAMIMALYIGCCVWFALVPGGVAGLVGLVSGHSGGQGQAPFRPSVLIPLLIGLITWFGSIADATVASKSRVHRPVDRPRPPIDLPFE